MQVNVSKAEVKCIIWEKINKGGKRGGIEGRKGGTNTDKCYRG